MQQELKDEIIARAMAELRYNAFSNPDQTNEYELKVTSNAIYFIPIMPTTYKIDESFYNLVYNLLNISLSPTVTMIRPLSMQIKILPDNEPAKQRALYFPMHLGRSKRLVCSIDDLVNMYHQIHAIPLMDRIAWDPVKSPHALIEGPSNSGKSYAMQTLFSICSKIGKTVVIDPKVSNLARLTKTEPASKVIIPDFDASTQQGIGGRYLTTVINELKSLETEMYRRQALLYKQPKISANFETLGLKPIFLFIDEVAALLTGASRQIKQDYIDTLTRLAILSRESGLTIIMASQQFNSNVTPTIVRDSMSLRIHLGRLNSQNSRFLFPELSDLPMIPIGGNGSGIVSIVGNNVTAGIEPISMPTIIDNEVQK